MATRFAELQRQVKELTSKEKAALARILIEDLDDTLNEDAERYWIEEAQPRYDVFKTGETTVSIPDAIERARGRLKRLRSS